MTIDYKIFDRDKFEVVGTPTITSNGIASGFSRSNYIKSIDQFSSYTTSDFEVTVNCIATNNTGVNPIVIVTDVETSRERLMLAVSTGQSFVLNRYNQDDTSLGYVTVTNDFIVGQKYWFKLGHNTNGYYVRYSKDGINYTTKSNCEGLSDTIFNINSICIGTRPRNRGHYFHDSIDLKQFSITIDGVEVFSGSKPGTLTDKLLYLNDTKQIIKSAIEAKGVQVPTETPFRQYADKIGEISGSTSANVFTKTGSVIISNDSIARGFTRYSYLTTLNNTFSSASSWEIKIPFTITGNPTSDEDGLFSQKDYGIQFKIDTSRVLRGAFGDGSSFFYTPANLANLSINTDYLLVIEYDGLNYKGTLNNEQIFSAAYSNKLEDGAINLGVDRTITHACTVATIDLKRLSIKINN